MNKAIIVGRLAHTPELKALPSGVMVMNASVATNYVYYDKDKQKQEVTDWHQIVAYGKTAENIAKFFMGGDQIIIEGRMTTRSWEVEGEKGKRYRTEIMVERFDFGAKKDRDDRKTSAPREQSAPQAQGSHPELPDYPEEEINPEDIPF